MTESALREPLIERAVDSLTADYERQDGRLESKQVDRTFEKRGLSVAECRVALERLDCAGIRIDEADEDDSSLQLDVESDTRETPATLLERYTSTDLRQRARDYRLLTAPEELELGRAIALAQRAQSELEHGDVNTDLHASLISKGAAAQSRMTLANLRLVAHVARPYFGMCDLTAEDLIQEGILGLIRAIQKYDHTLGLRFSTYATWWIRQAVTRAIADRGSTIRLPAHLVTELHRYRRAYRLLHLANPARNPTLAELADELVWPLDRVSFMQHLGNLQPMSLDNPVAGASDSSLVELLAADIELPEEVAQKNSLRRAIASAIAELKESERRVLDLRFGLNDASGGRTLEEVGQQLGITRERVRQIESKALTRMLGRARTRKDYLLAAYCPEALLNPDKAVEQNSTDKQATAPSTKKQKRRRGDSALRKEPEPFPRDYVWLR
jgi:RNA polymerase primary sigma factor